MMTEMIEPWTAAAMALPLAILLPAALTLGAGREMALVATLGGSLVVALSLS